MEENKSLLFDQLPSAVGVLIIRKPYEPTQEKQADFEVHLEMLQKSKKNKPASNEEGNL